mmetsp:Transcript_30248/g.37313  ORF Transcript_30248/g.37313 Transcript_30248/m.37313 type:complete len:195 (+) Transcript_30248:541-1125(+)
MLQNGTKLALETPNDWRKLIDSTGGRGETISLLVQLLDYVSRESSILCLTLATLTLESPNMDKQFSVARSIIAFNSQGTDGQSLFKFVQAIFNAEKEGKAAPAEKDKMAVDEKATNERISLDLKKLIDVYLLGKSDRKIRIATAQLIKGLYDREAVSFSELLVIMTKRFATLAAAGVNSAEFICIFGYICQREV